MGSSSGVDIHDHDGLALGLGFSTTTTTTSLEQTTPRGAVNIHNTNQQKPNFTTYKNKPSFKLSHHVLEPSLSLSLSDHFSKIINNTPDHHHHQIMNIINNNRDRQASPVHDIESGVSSLSSGLVKRERDQQLMSSSSTEETETTERSLLHEDVEDHDHGVNGRKKLRLNKEQSALLEESFKLHTTLNPKQKQALARQLNLRPRQVEVWFQNRRARTKLKQTEMDCEMLKKCCESLTEENRMLQKELQELKAIKVAQQFYMQMPSPTLTMCPSCETVGGVN